MSTISKVAVYDARLMQEEPAYAVQKGALSVSVAPFQSISASASQMTFQVLVPSLNVFVDRKISLSTTLNFAAQLFYSGPRGLTQSITGSAAATNGGAALSSGQCVLTVTGGFVSPSGTAVTVPVGTLIYSVTGLALLPGTRVVAALSASTYVITPFQIVAAQGTVNYLQPWSYTTPAASMSVSLAQDGGYSAAKNGQAFLPAGYATAVSAKDLSLIPFPVQGALNNMTATLNDCTVTTNGDTLREQIMLTSSHPTLKQRTTPTKLDTFCWGRDDANNESGNFSSYSFADGYGDTANGSWPITWYDALGTTALANITSVSGGSGNIGTYPFVSGSQVQFGSFGNVNGLNNGAVVSNYSTGGAGWYLAQQASDVAGSSKNVVVVPFVNGQPVWTTAFPGGDLYGTVSGNATDSALVSFTMSYLNGTTNVLTLTTDVPPYSMIGARLYAQAPNPIVSAGGPVIPVGWVCAIRTGALGCTGSTYTVMGPSQGIQIAEPQGGFALQGGFQCLEGPMPVFGSFESVEPLVLSPLIWADSAEFQSVGLYGMTNMQFILNFSATLGTTRATLNSIASGATSQGSTVPYWVDDLTIATNYCGNILRSSNIRTTISDLRFNSPLQGTNGPWTGPPTLYVNFLTPGPDVTLPLVSTVPYVEFPRYVTTVQQPIPHRTQLATNTISLTSIPDMVLLYVKPATKGPGLLDCYVPISNVSVTFDNFSNLCSGFQQFNLYESAVAAGLDMDWHQWRGYAQGAYPSLARTNLASNATDPPLFKPTGFTQLSGGPILLRMGTDITLSPGLAPGCLGNYSFQATMSVSNPYGYFDWVTKVSVGLIAINTGFFETVRGQSAIRKTILNSADVEAASPEEGMTKTDLHRLVGAGGQQGCRGMSTGMGSGLRRARTATVMGGRSRYGGQPRMSGLAPGMLGAKRPSASGL
jgi:hypothetical protein